MPESPLVAVVTPAYNGEKYLSEAMASVQAQDYENLVHVVLDNASDDHTAAIIARFKRARVPVLSARNMATLPVAQNWSAAAALAPPETKYFSMLCADDVLAPSAVRKMVRVAESDPGIDLVGCLAKRGAFMRPTVLPVGHTVYPGKEIARRFLNKEADDVPHMWGLYRRHARDFERDYFDASVVMFDTDACLRALARGKFGYVHDHLVDIRVHPGQLSAKVLKHSVFEPLVLIERWAQLVMDQREAKRCRERHIRAIRRFMLYWLASGQQDLVDRHRERLRQHGVGTGPWHYPLSVLEWPLHAAVEKYRHHKACAHTEALGFGPAQVPVIHLLPDALDRTLGWMGLGPKQRGRPAVDRVRSSRGGVRLERGPTCL